MSINKAMTIALCAFDSDERNAIWAKINLYYSYMHAINFKCFSISSYMKLFQIAHEKIKLKMGLFWLKNSQMCVWIHAEFFKNGSGNICIIKNYVWIFTSFTSCKPIFNSILYTLWKIKYFPEDKYTNGYIHAYTPTELFSDLLLQCSVDVPG